MTDSSETADSSVLVLYLPRLPGATEPVVGAHYGVPIHLYDLLPFGCRVVVDPYLGQQPGDIVSINLNGETGVASKPTQSFDDSVELDIPRGKLLPGMVNRLTYSVIRNSSNIDTSTPPLEILYNSIRPGHQDKSPGEPGHSELVLLLPDEIKNGVGPGFVSATVCVEYPYCRAYDVIRLNCNGHDVYRTVQESEAPAPPSHGSATPTRICFDVTSADLSDDPEFKFSFTVRDQLYNSPDLDNPWSAVQIVDVDQAGQKLPAPIPREVLSEAGDDPSLIDLAKLGSNPLSLIILTSDPRFMPGDVIEATYTAKVTGQPDVVVSVAGTVEVDELGQKKACVLQIPNDKVIPNSTVHVSYRLSRSTSPVGTSKIATATVIGAVIELSPPSIQEASGGTLNPVDAANSLTAVIPHYTGMLGSDKVSVTWTGSPGTPAAGSHTTAPVDVGTVGPKPIALPTSLVAYALGQSVTVTYTVTRGGDTWPVSPQLTLPVQAIPSERLTIPLIPQASQGGIGPDLDLRTFSGDAQVTVAPWPLIAVGQRVWLRADGTALDSTSFSIQLNTSEPVTAAQVTAGLSVPVPRTQIDRLRNGTTLAVILEVTFNQAAEQNQATPFPQRTYVVKPEPLDDLTRFDQGHRNSWEDGPAADPRDWNLSRDESGRPLIGNGTYTDRSAGVVLQKAYRGLRIGATYEFSLDARRHRSVGAGDAVPSIALATDRNGLISPANILSTPAWRTLTGTFVATTTIMQLQVVSNQSSGIGNDYYVTDIRVRML